MSISLCMIVKDEAARLPRCLASVRDWVDELIVVDTGSQDDTIALARDWGAQVTCIEWPDDFACARNHSLAQATGEWILVLDADETLTTAGQQLLRRIRQGQPLGDQPLDKVLLISTLRHERHAVQAPYSPVSRLFRNRPDLRFQRPYHETVDDQALAIVATAPQWRLVTWPQVTFDHDGYTAEAIAQRHKAQRARTLMERHLAVHPQDAYICNKLGALYIAEGDWQQGLPLLLQGLASDPCDPYTTYELHYHLGLAERARGQLDQAMGHYQQAIAQPIPALAKVAAHINLGSLYQAQQNFPAAVTQFEQATRIAPQLAIAYFNLGTAQRAQGALTAAIAAYEQALQRDPNYAAAWQNLGVALLKQGQVSKSLAAFQRAIQLYQQQDPALAQQLQQGIQQLGLPLP